VFRKWVLGFMLLQILLYSADNVEMQITVGLLLRLKELEIMH